MKGEINLKINFRGFNEKIRKLPFILGGQAFLIVLIIILIEVLIGGFLLYQYTNFPELNAMAGAETVIKFKTDTYNQVLSDWKTREERISGSAEKEYKNPFLPQ